MPLSIVHRSLVELITRRRAPAFLVLISFFASTLLINGVIAQDGQEQARRRLEQVRQAIQQLQDERESGDHERARMIRDLRLLETEIGELGKEVRSLNQQVGVSENELAELAEQREQSQQRLDDAREQLGAQLALAYRLGRQSRLKLLFNLEDPALSSRLLSYHGFFSRAQSRRIQAVVDQLEQLRLLAVETKERQATLAKLRDERTGVLKGRQSAYDQRQDVLHKLDSKLASLSERIGELRANQRDLENLLRRLQDALTDIPETLGDQPFRERLGKLLLPVNGKISVHYGRPEQDGRPGTGIVLGADAGSEVSSVGYGRVAFADWLRGFGLLMIIDHGDGYMSLYGRNESLLRDAGDWVRSGEIIAIVGQGNLDEPPGLYFELRKDGDAIDPERWFGRRYR